MSKETLQKILNIASKVLTWVIIAVTVFMMIFTIFSSLTFDRNDRNLFGIRFYIVLTDSMSPSENNKDDDIHFNAGDIVLIRNVKDATALQPGDVIAFISQNSDNFGETVTHMIYERRLDSEGNLIGYVTYGTNTGKLDQAIVEPEYVLGEYAGKLVGVGNFFAFLKTTPGYIVCILVPFLLLIFYQGVNTVKLFKKYKKEQMSDMQAEREQIAKEREQSAAMMQELIALREQLSKQNANATTAVTTDKTEQTAEKTEEKTENSAEMPKKTTTNNTKSNYTKNPQGGQKND